MSLHERRAGDEAVSRSTLQKVWRSRWNKYMQFRTLGQGKRCKICAELDELIRKAVDPDEREEYEKKKDQHIAGVMLDRDSHTRQNMMSSLHAGKKSVSGEMQMMKLVIDGMDQAKYRVPRNLKNSADLDRSPRVR